MVAADHPVFVFQRNQLCTCHLAPGSDILAESLVGGSYLKLFADLQRLVVLFQLHHRSGTHQSASIYFQQIDLGIGVSIACAFRYFRLVGKLTY